MQNKSGRARVTAATLVGVVLNDPPGAVKFEVATLHQAIPDEVPGAEDPCFRRGIGDTQFLGNLFLRDPVKFIQAEGVALLVGHVPQHFPDVKAQASFIDVLRFIGHLCLHQLVPVRRPQFPEMICNDVPRDHEDPGMELFPLLYLSYFFMDSDKGFLQQVLCKGPVIDPRKDEAEEVIPEFFPNRLCIHLSSDDDLPGYGILVADDPENVHSARDGANVYNSRASALKR